MKKLKILLLIAGISTCFSAHAVVFSIITTLLEELRSQASAWYITVKQMALSASQISSVTNTSAKTFTQSLNNINQNAKTVKAFVDYGAQFGQPLSTQCIEMAKTKQMLNKFEFSNQITANITGYEFSNSNQTKAGEIIANKINNHSEYCNEEEQKSGVCDTKFSKSSKPNVDTSIASILSYDELDKDAIKDAYNYNHKINTFEIDEKNNCFDNECKTNSYNQLQQNAFLSMSTYTINNQINQRAIETNINYEEKNNSN